MSDVGPRSSVFTTLLVHQNRQVADWSDHRSRLERHAERLRITLPDGTPILQPPEQHEWQLMRVSVNAQNQEWIVEYRPVNVRNEAIDAITLPDLGGISVPTGASTAIGALTGRRSNQRWMLGVTRPY